MIYLLDTDTLIYMARGLKISSPQNERQKKGRQLAERIMERCVKQQVAGDDVGLSAVTIAELEFGAHQSGDYPKEIVAVRKILTPFIAYDFDASGCAENYGEIRHALETPGKTIGAMDLLIAAHALALGATLVTNNTGHFSRVPDLLSANWTA